MSMLSIRFATQRDCRELLAIYGQYIGTGITFEYDLPSEEEFSRRIREFSTVYPYLVCCVDDKMAGYAYAHRAFERAAYGWTAELSVYVDMAQTGRGIGSRLYRAVMEILRVQNVCTVYGLVTMPNEKSQRLHEGLGFRPVGIMKGCGYKNGEWKDVCYFEKRILPEKTPPDPVIPIGEADQAAVARVLEKYSQMDAE